MLIFALGWTVYGQDTPLHLECDDLFISADQTSITAQGSVRAELDNAQLQADELQLNQQSADL
ncbi:MAG: hypothetical protein JJ992_18710, partial [Planctomycetes bacterium]|nr:hypothetical protein [Planctomycetota bacterium]